MLATRTGTTAEVVAVVGRKEATGVSFSNTSIKALLHRSHEAFYQEVFAINSGPLLNQIKNRDNQLFILTITLYWSRHNCQFNNETRILTFSRILTFFKISDFFQASSVSVSQSVLWGSSICCFVLSILTSFEYSHSFGRFLNLSWIFIFSRILT